MKFAFVISFLLCLGLSCNVNGLDCPENCPDTEELVWALGGRCYLYLNKCHYDKENCTRETRKYFKLLNLNHIYSVIALTALKIVTREECQPYCSAFCPESYKAVEGDLNYFGRACERIAHVCKTGERK
ncbi:hypothetical protein KR093_006860 [Drosophila rubida]|uniref:Uncharacterized protein n=1 Tax=Drosophila rubida TaxID=30044 RepID=A0AAD4K727_9MUSC|nr:hypothetical protein KR093_006860 [Drosophila rubida]